MLSFATITATPVPSAVLAAQKLVDHIQAVIRNEAAKVVAAMSTMDFNAYAVDGLMLTGAWNGACE